MTYEEFNEVKNPTWRLLELHKGRQYSIKRVGMFSIMLLKVTPVTLDAKPMSRDTVAHRRMQGSDLSRYAKRFIPHPEVVSRLLAEASYRAYPIPYIGVDLAGGPDATVFMERDWQ